MNKLNRVKKLEKELSLLRKDIENESKTNKWSPKGGEFYITQTVLYVIQTVLIVVENMGVSLKMKRML